MWKICKIYIILTVWMQTLNAQQVAYITNSRGDSELNSTQILDLNFEFKNDTLTRSNRIYNTNSRESFGNTQAENNLHSLTKERNINVPQQNTFNYMVHNLSIKSSIFDGYSAQSNQSSSECNISTGISFNSRLFEILSSKARYENLVFSPISLQTLLAFIFTMSDGKLFEELAQLLAISNNRTCVAKIFENLLQKVSVNTPTTTTIIMANKLYYDFRFGPLDHSVCNFAKNSFASELEQIDFMAAKKAADIINSWVSERTHNRIKDIVAPSTISADTNALLLNSLYFKSEWLTKFATYDTETQDFFMTKQTKTPVKMMYNEDVFRYGDFPDDLQASVVELPYITPNLSMLLILPKDIEGLADLERKLKYYDFESISKKLKRETVTIKLPKFKLEYEVDMIKPLQQMGLITLFNAGGNINLFKNQQKPLKIDQLKHKCFINVNEAGTEAAATTVAKYVSLSIPTEMKYFVADHPFVFVVRDSNTTFFIGHIVQF